MPSESDKKKAERSNLADELLELVDSDDSNALDFRIGPDGELVKPKRLEEDN